MNPRLRGGCSSRLGRGVLDKVSHAYQNKNSKVFIISVIVIVSVILVIIVVVVILYRCHRLLHIGPLHAYLFCSSTFRNVDRLSSSHVQLVDSAVVEGKDGHHVEPSRTRCRRRC